jgi:serine/threonine-protein kinase RsbT
MKVLKTDTQDLKNSNDMVLARQKVRVWTTELRFSLVDQTKLVTAASELARNALEHGKGGVMTLETIENGPKMGLRLIFEDQGPGIADLSLALKDGYTSASGMGLGLGGSKRLVNEFSIESEVGKGTKVTVIRWR